MKKLFLNLLIAAIFVSFVSPSFAQRGGGNGGRGGRGDGSGICPRVTQSINQKDTSCFRLFRGANRPNRGNRPNRPNNSYQQRIMNPANLN